MSTTGTPTNPHSYSFRNTPTRNEGNGAYDSYFKGAVKIRQSSNESEKTETCSTSNRKSLFNQTVSAYNDTPAAIVRKNSMHVGGSTPGAGRTPSTRARRPLLPKIMTVEPKKPTIAKVKKTIIKKKTTTQKQKDNDGNNKDVSFHSALSSDESPDDDYVDDNSASDDESIMSIDTTAVSMRSAATTTANKSIMRLKGQAPKTPSLAGSTGPKKRAGIMRRNTMAGALASPANATPSLQKRMFSKLTSQNNLSAYEKARIKLHVANTPDCLPCRDVQFSDIFNFIETNINNQTGGCMYICGVPGTGKTLTTRQVISCLKESVSEQVVRPFKFIDVNAFQVTEPRQIYKLIYKELTDQNVSAEHACMLLEKKFEQKNSESIVLLVDELDMLATKKQDVLYNIFDWPYKRNSKWVVIAIANAMNLPEQVMSKISSRLGLSRLIFQPYSHAQLEEIVTLRLAELNVFDMDAIVFAARKVASVSGDARRALEICRRATELAEKQNKKGNNENLNPTIATSKTSVNTLVNISHVDAAIRSMFSSAKIVALGFASKMEQLFMRAISIIYQNSGIEETTLNRIHEQHNHLCASHALSQLNRSQFLNVCCSLASSKLILLEPSKNVYLQRVRCNMNSDDIDYVLKNNNLL